MIEENKIPCILKIKAKIDFKRLLENVRIFPQLLDNEVQFEIDCGDIGCSTLEDVVALLRHYRDNPDREFHS